MGMVRRNKWKFKSPLHQNVKHTYCIKSIQDKNAAVIIFRDLFHQNRYIFHHNGNYFIRISFALYLSVIENPFLDWTLCKQIGVVRSDRRKKYFLKVVCFQYRYLSMYLLFDSIVPVTLSQHHLPLP